MLYDRLRQAREVIKELRNTLEGAKFAGSPKTAARIRLAITSAQGAIRHLEGLYMTAYYRERREEEGRG